MSVAQTQQTRLWENTIVSNVMVKATIINYLKKCKSTGMRTITIRKISEDLGLPMSTIKKVLN